MRTENGEKVFDEKLWSGEQRGGILRSGGRGRDATHTVRHEEYHQRGVRSQNGAFEKLFGVEEHILQPRRVEFRVRDTFAITDVLV